MGEFISLQDTKNITIKEVKDLYTKKYHLSFERLFNAFSSVGSEQQPLMLVCLKVAANEYKDANNIVDLAGKVREQYLAEELKVFDSVVENIKGLVSNMAFSEANRTKLLSIIHFYTNIFRLKGASDLQTEDAVDAQSFFETRENALILVKLVINGIYTDIKFEVAKKNGVKVEAINILATSVLNQLSGCVQVIESHRKWYIENSEKFDPKIQAEVKKKNEAERKQKEMQAEKLRLEKEENARKESVAKRAKARELAKPVIKELNKIMLRINGYNGRVSEIERHLEEKIGINEVSLKECKLDASDVSRLRSELDDAANAANVEMVEGIRLKLDSLNEKLDDQVAAKKELMHKKIVDALDSHRKGKAASLKVVIGDFKKKEIKRRIEGAEAQINKNFFGFNKKLAQIVIGKVSSILSACGSFNDNFEKLKISLNGDGEVSATKWKELAYDMFEPANSEKYKQWKERRPWEYFSPERYKLRLDRAEMARLAYQIAINVNPLLLRLSDALNALQVSVETKSSDITAYAKNLDERITALKDEIALQKRAIGKLVFKNTSHNNNAEKIKEKVFQRTYALYGAFDKINSQYVMGNTEDFANEVNVSNKLKSDVEALNKIIKAESDIEAIGAEVEKAKKEILVAVNLIDQFADMQPDNSDSFSESDIDITSETKSTSSSRVGTPSESDNESVLDGLSDSPEPSDDSEIDECESANYFRM